MRHLVIVFLAFFSHLYNVSALDYELRNNIYYSCMKVSGQDALKEELDDRVKSLAIIKKISFVEAETKIKESRYYKMVYEPVFYKIEDSCLNYASAMVK